MPKVIDTILVFRESPEWNKTDRWFNLRADVLESLFLDRWQRTIPDSADEQEYDAVDEEIIAKIRESYDFPVVIVA